MAEEIFSSSRYKFPPWNAVCMMKIVFLCLYVRHDKQNLATEYVYTHLLCQEREKNFMSSKSPKVPGRWLEVVKCY